MKKALGILLMIAGVAFGVYVGLWLCFVGGVVQIVDAVQAHPVSGMDIAIGIVRVLCTGVAGVGTAVVAVFPGFALTSS